MKIGTALHGRLPKRLLYVVSHSFPFSSNGYAVRTHGVARALVKVGIDVIVVTYANETIERAKGGAIRTLEEVRVDGVRYFLVPDCGLANDLSLSRADSRVMSLFELSRVFRPQAIMAASNWRTAQPAREAATRVAVPFFYEIRGFWELSQVARDPDWRSSGGFVKERDAELDLTQTADHVFTLNHLMRDELVKRGVDGERISLVPNGVRLESSAEGNQVDFKDLGIHAQHVVGYIGSFTAYEGVEDLIQAIAQLRTRGIDVALLLVGSGEPRGFGAGNSGKCAVTEGYRQLARGLNISDYVITPGRLKPDQAKAYYELMDLVVIPRRPHEVCELVSPMKPLEALAAGKRVLLSDVAPLADLSNYCPYFHYFKKGDVNDLTDAIELLVTKDDWVAPSIQSLSLFSWDNSVKPIAGAIDSLRSKRKLRLM